MYECHAIVRLVHHVVSMLVVQPMDRIQPMLNDYDYVEKYLTYLIVTC